MPPAIWSAILLDQPLPATLRFLHSCGWECFELSTEHLEQIDSDDDPAPRIDEAKQVLDDLDAAMPQAHAYLAANVAHPDETRRRADLVTLQRHLGHCAALGVNTVVVHPGRTSYTTRDELRRIIALNVESFTVLSDCAGELGLTIGIENMMDTPAAEGRSFGATPYELLDLLARVDSPALGIAFDTSHANVQGLDLAAAIRELGKHIRATHISDNDGSGDQHLIPGNGNIDWPAVMAALRGIGYDGLFDLEIPGDLHPVRDILALKLRHAREVAGWLIGQA